MDAEGEADQLESDDDRMHVVGADFESEDSVNGGSRRASVAAGASSAPRPRPAHPMTNGSHRGAPHHHHHRNGYPPYNMSASGTPMDDDPDADAEGDLDLDADGDLEMAEDGPAPAPRASHPGGHASRRGAGVPQSLADLDSPSGR